MTIEVTGPDGTVSAFPDGTPTSVMQAALANGGSQTAGSTLALLGDPGAPQLSPVPQGQTDPGAGVAPNLVFAALPPGGGYGPIADAAKAAASPWLNALASNPSPVWNQRLGLLGHARALREAAASMAGSMLGNGDNPAMAGLALDPDSGAWTLPKRLDGVMAGPAPTAATWLGLYHTLPSLMQTDPWTGEVLSDADSPRNANIASIAGKLSDAFIGDPWTGAGGAIPGYGPIQGVFGDPFTIRAAHDAMDGTLFSSDPDAFTGAWAQASTPAEQAAARAAVASEIQDRIHNGQVLPGQMGSPFMQNRLAPMFGPAGAQTIAAQAESLLASRYAASADDQAPSAPVVTAPPTPALATAPQPFVPTTPIAASLIQGFDPGGIASSLRPTGLGPNRSGAALPGTTANRVTPPVSPDQRASGSGYPGNSQVGAPPPDAAGIPEVIVNGRRLGPLDYLRRLAGDLGSANFPAAGTDFDGLADTSGMSAPINGIAGFVRNLAGDINWRYRAADSALGEARYDLSRRSVTNSPLQNLWLGAQALAADGKAGLLGKYAGPLALADGTLGAGLNTLNGGQGPGGLVGDDYYTNGLLKVVPAFAGVPEATLAETAPLDIEALFEANSLRAANEAHELFHQYVDQGTIQPNPNLPPKLQAGRFMDDAIRMANLRLRAQLGLDSNSVRINQRLYAGEGRYTVPDIHFPASGNVMDYSYQLKSMKTPQIRLFRSASPNGVITIIPPPAVRPVYKIEP